MAEDTPAADLIAQLAAVVEPPDIEFSKDSMYDELATVLGDFLKVIAARKAGMNPFPDSAATDEKGKKDKKNRPPRAPSAYNNFMKTVQDKVKLQYPDLKQTELMKHIAILWNCSDEKKVSDKKRQEAIEASKKVQKDKKEDKKVKKEDKKDKKVKTPKKSEEKQEEPEEPKEEPKKEKTPKKEKKEEKEGKKSKKRSNDEETPSKSTRKKSKKGEKGGE